MPQGVTMPDKPKFKDIRDVRRRAVQVMFHIALDNQGDNGQNDYFQFPSDTDKAGPKVRKGTVKAMVFFLDDQGTTFMDFESTLVLPEKNTGRVVNLTIGRFLQQFGLRTDQVIKRLPSYITYTLAPRPRKAKPKTP